MDEATAARDLRAILTQLGLARGQTVYLGVDMGGLPLPSYPAALDRAALRTRERRWCEFVLNILMDTLGPGGTLVVPTFTYSCGASGVSYVHEETPSEIGPLTEYVRQHPAARRSLHPIFSTTALGPNAAIITDDVGGAAFGANSAFGRLAKLQTRFLCLGVALHRCITYVHHLEQCHGSNHRYNKILTTPVFREGVRNPGPWLAYVRYLSVDATQDFLPLETELRGRGMLREASWRGRPYQITAIEDVETVGYRLLAQNPRVFATRNLDIHLDESGMSGSPAREDSVILQLSRRPDRA